MEEFMYNNETIYIIPTEDKPVKIIYEGFPCPILLKLDIDFNCGFAKTKNEDTEFIIYCTKQECEYFK